MAFDLYVSPQGNDHNSGTQSQPLATLHAARDLLRQKGNLGQEPIRVILLEGIYRMHKPLTLTPRDSGTEKAKVTYMAAEGAEVTLTGALRLDLDWRPYKDGIFKAKLASEEAIDQLFVNQERQRMARFPNASDNLDVPFTAYSANAWDPKDRGWKNPVGAYLHAIHGRRWGGTHYEVTGIDNKGNLIRQGGWQDNRAVPPHREFRMVENVFEELDVAGEWFYDLAAQTLYCYPNAGVDLTTAKVDAVFERPHLIEFYGNTQQPSPSMTVDSPGNGMKKITFETHVTTEPVKHIIIHGLRFTGSARTFMKTKEPLLRSDWTIYRGGAIHLRGTDNITITQSHFDQLGGNAIFVDGYNRGAVIKGNLFDRNGATDINFVGSPAAVRDPIFSYSPGPPSLDAVDTEKGPKSEEYPADCLVEDNLMGYCGRVEKQPAGVNLAMASRITIRHNTIHHTPRAAINICSGAWGGHIIEWNDCFETVLETHDHGAFNSWGRDRYWFHATPSGPAKGMDEYVAKYPDMMLWDAYQKIIIRNNRMHCDHGWDIDLDDGSTHYDIYNNLCLSGGIKTREGFYRNVFNNIIINGVYTCNVPYPAPVYDTFKHNIFVSGFYSTKNPKSWKGLIDRTFFHVPGEKTRPANEVQEFTAQDANSLVGDAMFKDPEKGDFTLKAGSPALAMGFKNFPMTGFGVTSAYLKKSAPQPLIRIPRSYYIIEHVSKGNYKSSATIAGSKKIPKFLGAEMDDLDTLSEMTAYGAPDKTGVILVNVPVNSPMDQFGFQTDDVILIINNKSISNQTKLKRQFKSKEILKVKILRNQAEQMIMVNR
ncbi:MAG: PDZ domain-containing protein [Verrucomicrobiota bacterium]